MRLPRGAAGFGASAGNPDRDAHGLAAIAHYAARRTRGTLITITPAGPTPNFHTAELAYPSQRLAILRHGTLPLLALARSYDRNVTTMVQFLDNTQLAATIHEASELRILATAELDAPLSSAGLSDLDDGELRQIRHWEPATIGQVLFN